MYCDIIYHSMNIMNVIVSVRHWRRHERVKTGKRALFFFFHFWYFFTSFLYKQTFRLTCMGWQLIYFFCITISVASSRIRVTALSLSVATEGEGKGREEKGGKVTCPGIVFHVWPRSRWTRLCYPIGRRLQVAGQSCEVIGLNLVSANRW